MNYSRESQVNRACSRIKGGSVWKRVRSASRCFSALCHRPLCLTTDINLNLKSPPPLAHAGEDFSGTEVETCFSRLTDRVHMRQFDHVDFFVDFSYHDCARLLVRACVRAWLAGWV